MSSIKHKKELLGFIVIQLNEELRKLTDLAVATRSDPSQEPSPSNPANQTLWARLETLKSFINAVQETHIREFRKRENTRLGALVEVETEGKRIHYLLMAQGDGITVLVEKKTIHVLTPNTPLGDALLGVRVGDRLEKSEHIAHDYKIISIQ